MYEDEEKGVKRSREMTITEDKDDSNNNKRMYNVRGRRRGRVTRRSRKMMIIKEDV